MNLNWSNREGRIGVTMKDVSLAFWDWSDQFSYQKSFSVSQFVTDYQSQIWYLDIF